MALKSNGVTQVPDGLGSANQVLKVNSAGTAGEWGSIATTDNTKLPLAGGTMTGDINFGDNNKASFGASNNLEIYHDGIIGRPIVYATSPLFIASTGNIWIGGDSIGLGNPGSSEYFVQCVNNGEVKLYHDNAEKLATTSTGIDVTGNANFANNGKAIFGASNNLQIFSTGTSSYVAESGSGDLYIKGSSIYLTDTDNNQYIHLSDTGTGGTVVLKHNAVSKLATTATGIDVTGNITVSGYIAGPAVLTIDPAGVGDNTGKVVIAGDLQIDGTTTTINSTTLTVDDLNITLASGAADSAAANGAGITVDGANATITYDGTNDEWDFNKDVNVTGNIALSGTVDGVDIAARDSVLTSTTTTANAALPKAGGAMTGAITTNSTFDGRNVSVDGSKLDGIEAGANVTDTANVTAAGALMDSELASITDVKAINQSVISGATPTFGIDNLTIDDTDLVVSDTTNLQTFAEGVDSALLKARGTGVTSTYVSTVAIGGTTFAQPAVEGEINSDEGYFSISYAGATGITVANLTATSTYVYIDKSGNLQQQTSIPTRQDWSRKVFTMRISVDTTAGTILGFEYLNNPIGHYANSIRDLYTYLLAQGIPLKKGQTVTGRSGDLGFDVGSGSIMEFGGTGDINNANILSFNAVSNTSYTLLSRTGIVSVQTDLQKYWDNNGTITALGSTTLVGHRLYRYADGAFAMQYGQGNYANMALAKAGAVLENYVLNPLLEDATFFGWWFIESTATNTGGTTLTDFSEYTIGIRGGSSGSLAGCLLKGNNLSDLQDTATARTNLGLEVGVDVQSFATVLDNTTASFLIAEQSKLTGIEAGANVTDTANVTLAGALMDSEVTNLAQVKAFDETDYATAAQGTLATNALPKSGGAMTGAITTTSTFDGRNVSVDGDKLDLIETGATADQTAAQLLAAIKTVDVNGSAGVNAGTLDGLGSGSFLRSNAPDTFSSQLILSGTGDVTLTSTAHPFQIGLSSGANIAMDNNEIQSRSNGAAATLYVQLEGGATTFGGNININGSGTVDGRDVSVDGSKLDGIEAGATADQTAAQILAKLKTVDVNGTAGVNAGTLDGLGSGSFLRSDANDTTVSQITISNANPQIKFNDTSSGADDFWVHVNSNNFYVLTDRDESGAHESPFPMQLEADTNKGYIFGGEVWTSANDGAGSGLDADLLDGVQGSSFLRSDATDTFTTLSGTSLTTTNLTVGSSAKINFQNNDSISYSDSDGVGAFSFNADAGTANAKVKAGAATFSSVTVSGTVDGVDIAARNGVLTSTTTTANAALPKAGGTLTGDIVSNARSKGVFGTYNSTLTDHIWSMGAAYRNHVSGTNFGNLYGLAYKHTNNATGGTMAGGHQAVWCQNGVGKSAIGTNIWTSGDVTAYSDRRVKENLVIIPNAIDKVKQLNGYTYDRTDQEAATLEEEGVVYAHNPTNRHVGIIAQELLEVLPEAVTGGPNSMAGSEDDHYSVAYGNVVALLIEAVKEQQTEIDELKKLVKDLMSR